MQAVFRESSARLQDILSDGGACVEGHLVRGCEVRKLPRYPSNPPLRLGKGTLAL